jgi:hypothetical protein
VDGVRLDGLEFCARTYEIFERVRTASGGTSDLRLRRGTAKRIIEELLPIAAYIQSKYMAGHYFSVCWTNGNQIGDARVYQHGAVVEARSLPASYSLEVTSAMHANAHLARELLEKEGHSFGLDGISVTRTKKSRVVTSKPISNSTPDLIKAFAKIVVDEIKKKSNRPYQDGTVLVVDCNLNTIYGEDTWRELIEQLRPSLPEGKFSEIFLVAGAYRLNWTFN